MKKSSLALLLLFFIILFAALDYGLNARGSLPGKRVTSETPDEAPNLTQKLLEKNPLTLESHIVSRQRTLELFEKFDLSPLESLRIYRNHIEFPTGTPLILYEVQGPGSQGGVSYLKVKLALLDQIDATEHLNETNDYGEGSFYFNDLNAPETAFMLTQVGDHLYGFQYGKRDTQNLEIIKSLIQTLTTFNL